MSMSAQPSTSTSPNPIPSNWDQLRRLAKQLETKCQSQLALYARQASSKSTSLDTIQSTHTTLEDLLNQLSQVVDQLGIAIPATAPPSSLHLIQRQKDVLSELHREFRRLQSNWTAAHEHQQLLGSVQADIHAAKSVQSSEQQYFLSERGKINQTEIMMEDVIAQAHETRLDLDTQRDSLLSSQRRLGSLQSTFPQLTSLLTRIRFRRRRDTIIVSCVTASCLFIMFLYYF